MQKAKEQEAKETAKLKAREMEMQRREAARKAALGGGGMGGGYGGRGGSNHYAQIPSSSTPPAFPSASSQVQPTMPYLSFSSIVSHRDY